MCKALILRASLNQAGYQRENGILVLVCVGVAVKHTMYQRKVDVDMLNAVKSVLADVSSVSPSSAEQS